LQKFFKREKNNQVTAQKSSITSTHYSLSLLLCFSLSSVREREREKKRERERLLVFLCVFVFGALKSLIKERERDRLEIRFLRHSSAAGLGVSLLFYRKYFKGIKKE